MENKIELYNTLTRTIEVFRPVDPQEVRLYTCGLTVYDYAHIGNLRTYLFEDLLRRTLQSAGYRVRHVMNITDVGHLTDDADLGEDKLTRASRQSGQSVWDIARFYTKAFTRDLERMNILAPTVQCPATEHISEMISLIERLESAGYTYQAAGNVYFDTTRFPDYGRLASLDLDGQLAGARIAVDPNKRNPRDFVLWFTHGKFEHQAMLWDSPWGRGYPGWHIECSAMAMKYLGARVDIHCGGVDHIPVHHTNEIAQSEAALGHRWVTTWMHGEWLLITGGKMGKSKGNFITLENLLEEGFDAMDYRYYLLGAHYRKQLSFSREALAAAQTARHRLVENLVELQRESAGDSAGDSVASRPTPKEQAFWDALYRDLNSPQALSAMWSLVKDDEINPADRLASIRRMGQVLGLRLLESVTRQESPDHEIEALIQERDILRLQGQYEKADMIGADLAKKGVVIRDTPNGARWTKESRG